MLESDLLREVSALLSGTGHTRTTHNRSKHHERISYRIVTHSGPVLRGFSMPHNGAASALRIPPSEFQLDPIFVGEQSYCGRRTATLEPFSGDWCYQGVLPESG